MLKFKFLRPEFVKHFPDVLEAGVLYISEEYASAGHLCCCGCGEEVITPLNPAQWQLRKSEAGISLYPSVGNWKFACQSHYWISDNCVEDAGAMSRSRIDAVKRRDRRDKDRYAQLTNASAGIQFPVQQKSSFLGNISNWWRELWR